jgi:hypothetical protein
MPLRQGPPRRLSGEAPGRHAFLRQLSIHGQLKAAPPYWIGVADFVAIFKYIEIAVNADSSMPLRFVGYFYNRNLP